MTSKSEIVALNTVVVVVSDWAHITGGQSRIAIEECLGLKEIGVRVILFAAVGPVDSRLTVEGVEVICLHQHELASNPSSLNAMISGLWNQKGARSLEKLLSNLRDFNVVVHVHGWAKALSPSIGWVLCQHQLKVVYTMHEYFLACPNGAFYNYRQKELCQRTPLGFDCVTTNCDSRNYRTKIWRLIRQLLLRGVAKWPSSLTDIICISKTQHRVILPFLPPNTRLHYIPNPVSFVTGPRVCAEENDTYVYVGRFSPEKGAPLFSEAARRAGVRALFMGSGVDEARILANYPDAKIVAWGDKKQVENVMKSARAIVFPSLWYETAGLVPMEAQARGIPVILGAWSAATDFVSPYGGIFVQDRSGPAWEQAILKMSSSPLVREMSIKGFEFMASKDYSLDTHIEKLCTLYDNMLNPDFTWEKNNSDLSIRD